MPADPRSRFANRLAELAKLIRGAKTAEDRERVAVELDRIAGLA